ncbi:hypothetical protein Ahy_A10g049821 [Arachis hypogaea]|uniref:Uncharacterized protein n=1 Tax=Arachis hypogaea TaxID=3818 RepID=A0A445B804_ARAHY|nr:hypothetical protein Ahy_A10g049821 [Arachis hypogaea]
MYQGWNTPRWEEPQGIDHSYWQQPPDTYRYNSHPNACQFNGYDDSSCGTQQPPSYAYESHPQHEPQPFSQAFPYQAPSYDPYPSYDQSSIPYFYDHFEQEPLESPQPYQDYSQEPPQCTPSLYPYQEEPPSYYEPSLQNNEPSYSPQAPIDDPLTLLLQGQEAMKRDTLEFVTNLTKVVHTLTHQCLKTQGTSVTTCERSKEEQSMKERLENPVETEELNFVLEQLEKPMIIEEKEEVVEDLGDVESPWECSIMEHFPKKLDIDVEEGAQPPRHVIVEDLEEAYQEMDSIMDEFLSTMESSPIGHGVEIIEECAQPPIPLVSNEKENYQEGKVGMVYIEIEEYEEVDQEINSFINEFLSKVESPPIKQDEALEDNTKPRNKRKKVEIEEACEEVETTKEEHKEVDLASSKCGETSLPKSPSNTTFKWVKSLSLSFNFSLEYGLIENDGQLRTLCGLKSKNELCSGWKVSVKLIKVKASRYRDDVGTRITLYGSRKKYWWSKENSLRQSHSCQPPIRQNHGTQLTDGCENKIWDPVDE